MLRAASWQTRWHLKLQLFVNQTKAHNTPSRHQFQTATGRRFSWRHRIHNVNLHYPPCFRAKGYYRVIENCYNGFIRYCWIDGLHRVEIGSEPQNDIKYGNVFLNKQMNRIRYISRSIFFLAAVLLLVYINRKTDESTQSIAEFKFKMFQKIQTDSLDSKHKLTLLVDETTKFIDDSSRVKKGINYLTLLFALLIVVEFVFLVLAKRNGRQDIS